MANWGAGAKGAAGGAAMGSALGPWGAAVGGVAGGLVGLFGGGGSKGPSPEELQRQAQMQALIGRLEGQATGKDSYSAGELRQSANRNMAQQMAMAASSRPGQAASAGRIAAQQSARIGSGLAGQQSLAGIAERNAANSALGQILMGNQGQANDMERLKVQQEMSQPSTEEKMLGAGQGLAQWYAASQQSQNQPQPNVVKPKTWGYGMYGDDTFNR